MAEESETQAAEQKAEMLAAAESLRQSKEKWESSASSPGKDPAAADGTVDAAAELRASKEKWENAQSSPSTTTEADLDRLEALRQLKTLKPEGDGIDENLGSARLVRPDGIFFILC